MDVFALVIPDCPARSTSFRVLPVEKSILRMRLDTVKQNYEQFASAPDDHMREFKHALRVIKYMIEDVVDSPSRFNVSETIVLTESLKNLASVIVAGDTLDDARYVSEFIEQLQSYLL